MGQGWGDVKLRNFVPTDTGGQNLLRRMKQILKLALSQQSQCPHIYQFLLVTSNLRPRPTVINFCCGPADKPGQSQTQIQTKATKNSEVLKVQGLLFRRVITNTEKQRTAGSSSPDTAFLRGPTSLGQIQQRGKMARGKDDSEVQCWEQGEIQLLQCHMRIQIWFRIWTCLPISKQTVITAWTALKLCSMT